MVRAPVPDYTAAVIGNIAQFWRLTRELNVRGLRDQFERPARMSVLGSDLASAERIARLIDPDPLLGGIEVGRLGEPGPMGADVHVLALGGQLDPAARRAVAELVSDGTPIVVVVLQAEGGADMLVVGVPEERMVVLPPDWDDPLARERVLSALVQAAPEAMLPLGRQHPPLRDSVARQLIRETARVNAQFAALSSLPANVPLVGGLVGDMADMLVLTKNQILLLFKLAGLYGRDLELGQQLLVEVLPVVGGAFFWRSTARALVGLLPSVLGLLPKTIIAYTGTYVVGELARYYYQVGRQPPPGLARDLRIEGERLARRLFGPRG